jgi:uncharacterized OsmC-like protein
VGDFQVVVAAGVLQSSAEDAVHFPHRWTPEGVTAEMTFTGAHLLHLAAAGCVLNDVYREAERLGVPVRGVRVRASGGYDSESWQSTGIEYAVEIDSPAAAEQLAAVLDTVDSIAEIPRAIRAGTSVTRVGG